jgi:chorismate mutase
METAMTVRGIRGAIDVEEDLPELINQATRRLLDEIIIANPGLHPEDLASAYFSVTEDLVSTYPALAAREIGWSHVPLLCTREIPVPGGLPRCIRVLLHWNTDLAQSEINHVYLGRAAVLRPDILSVQSRRNGG